MELLAAAGVRVLERDTSRIRFVTHRLIGDEDVERAAAIVGEVVERNAVPPLELPDLDWVEALEAPDWEEDEAEARRAALRSRAARARAGG